jgi:small-conductance mechanosensitive channel
LPTEISFRNGRKIKMKPMSFVHRLLVLIISLVVTCLTAWSQLDSVGTRTAADTTARLQPRGIPVVFAGDTVFFIYSPLGEFKAEERAEHIAGQLRFLARNDWSLDSLRLVENGGVTDALLDTLRVFSVTSDDAAALHQLRSQVAGEYKSIAQKVIRSRRAELSLKELLQQGGIVLLFLVLLLVAFWGMRRIFPHLHTKLEGWEGKYFPSIRFRSRVILRASTIVLFHIIVLKALRLTITLALLYYFLLYLLSVIPWTRSWDPGPLLQGLLYSTLLTAAAGALLRGGRVFFGSLGAKVDGWRGTLIKPVRVKTVEILSEERIAGSLKWGAQILQLAAAVMVIYLYVTIIFSFFEFSQTWAKTLVGYVVSPLRDVFVALVSYLPNVFFIVVIAFVTRYVLKVIHLIFLEIGKGTISLPGFYREWSEPTYKIVRFLVIAFAAVVIFPYLPGSSSPAFQGISVFLGVLFSLGSTSAIANVVAGVVLTYMRPFKIGDRVKIADTLGDVIEKTLLVTRVRTIKNVDITIPNAMVLGSHIINFSSSAQARGLILHSSVTIGYDVPWRKVHELLIAAANATEDILKDPAPFVLQTSLDDSYVSYELNAYTDKPNLMASIYSQLHQNIQDKFNEACVEIMSPHYSAVRDGNKAAIPDDYLPKGYAAPSFRIFPFGNPPSEPGSKRE